MQRDQIDMESGTTHDSTGAGGGRPRTASAAQLRNTLTSLQGAVDAMRSLHRLLLDRMNNSPGDGNAPSNDTLHARGEGEEDEGLDNTEESNDMSAGTTTSSAPVSTVNALERTRQLRHELRMSLEALTAAAAAGQQSPTIVGCDEDVIECLLKIQAPKYRQRKILEGECPICQEDVDELPAEETQLAKSYTQLPCCHRFCTECIVGWLRLCNTCPICRATVTNPDDADDDGSKEEEENRRQAEAGKRRFLALVGSGRWAQLGEAHQQNGDGATCTSQPTTVGGINHRPSTAAAAGHSRSSSHTGSSTVGPSVSLSQRQRVPSQQQQRQRDRPPTAGLPPQHRRTQRFPSNNTGHPNPGKAIAGNSMGLGLSLPKGETEENSSDLEGSLYSQHRGPTLANSHGISAARSGVTAGRPQTAGAMGGSSKNNTATGPTVTTRSGLASATLVGLAYPRRSTAGASTQSSSAAVGQPTAFHHQRPSTAVAGHPSRSLAAQSLPQPNKVSPEGTCTQQLGPEAGVGVGGVRGGSFRLQGRRPGTAGDSLTRAPMRASSASTLRGRHPRPRVGEVKNSRKTDGEDNDGVKERLEHGAPAPTGTTTALPPASPVSHLRANRSRVSPSSTGSSHHNTSSAQQQGASSWDEGASASLPSREGLVNSGSTGTSSDSNRRRTTGSRPSSGRPTSTLSTQSRTLLRRLAQQQQQRAGPGSSIGGEQVLLPSAAASGEAQSRPKLHIVPQAMTRIV